ncbi:cell envelope biogenesis protein TolA [Xenophilus sp. AP218F]|nr:cell envelope biogenesis protein TolA [Xenophilus sp. AP218F]
MNSSPSRALRPWTLIVSILFHALVIALLLWGGFQAAQDKAAAPLALELWTTAPPPPPDVAQPVAPTPPAPRVETPPALPTPPADVNLGRKPRHEPEKKVEPKPAEPPKPEPKPKPEPVKKAEPKPEKTPEKKPARTVETPPAKTAKPSKPAKAYNPEADDALSSLDSLRASGKGNARSDAAGSKNGVAGGSVNGSAVSAGWVSQVKAKVRPLVQIPPELQGNPTVQLRVTLLPTLEVKTVQLLKSSGSRAYDEAVQRAVWEARRMPTLPAGANFNDGYRVFTLTFRPNE